MTRTRRLLATATPYACGINLRQHVTKHKIGQWQPPHPGRVKINFNGSVQHTSIVGGHIIRDWKGTLLRAGSNYYGCASIIVAEARALHDAVQAAYSAGHKDLIIEGDNQVIIKALPGTTTIPWQISNTIKDVRYWLRHSHSVAFRYVSREANMAADWMSKYGHTPQSTMAASSPLQREL